MGQFSMEIYALTGSLLSGNLHDRDKTQIIVTSGAWQLVDDLDLAKAQAHIHDPSRQPLAQGHPQILTFSVDLSARQDDLPVNQSDLLIGDDHIAIAKLATPGLICVRISFAHGAGTRKCVEEIGNVLPFCLGMQP